jgi:endonuclease YncB( thermonuclease family)
MDLIKFWKKDTINKLIVITFLLLVVGVFIIVEMIINMPAGKSLKGVFSEFLPEATPTLAFPTPTLTAIPTSEIVLLPTFTPFPTMPVVIPTETPAEVTLEPTTAPIDAEEFETSTAEVSLSAACVPNKTPQNGRVVEVLDGSTIRVLMNGLVYVVRYIGMENPPGKFQSENARLVNSNLVYAKDVQLIRDATDKDANGRMLRYVLVDDTFVNLELLQKGAVVFSKSEGAASCDQTFESAEHFASSAGLGLWAIASPTPAP